MDVETLPGNARAGVTLLELLIVAALIGLLVGLTFPSVSSGLDSIRLTAAADQIVGLLNLSVTRAERLQESVLVEIYLAEGRLEAVGLRSRWTHQVELPSGIRIARVLPEATVDEDSERQRNRQLVIYPGGATPAVELELVNGRGQTRRVRLDPITGLAQAGSPGS